jgi:hypothetical protein
MTKPAAASVDSLSRNATERIVRTNRTRAP